MAISADQQATLQLLLERGQSYGDLATLLSQDEAEVRARARGALTELGGADPDRSVGLTDYLLGQADPIGRADVSRHLREDPGDHQLATELAETLRAMFPAAELPRLPGEPRSGGRRRRKQPPATAGAPAPARASLLAGLSDSQRRLIVIAAGAGVLLLVVVLAIAGVFGGGDDQTTAATTTGATAPTDDQVQRVPLRSVGGGDARGEANFGLATGDQPFVDVTIDGLDPAPADRAYVIWLMLTETEGYPLSPITVSENGSLEDRFSIPPAVLSLIARVRFVDVSIAPVATIRELVRDAVQESALVLEEPGEVVLRGEVPTASAQADGSGAGGSSGN